MSRCLPKTVHWRGSCALERTFLGAFLYPGRTQACIKDVELNQIQWLMACWNPLA